VGVELKGPAALSSDGYWPVEESLAELAQLARTAGLVVVGQAVQRLEHPHPATFIGPGKVREVGERVAETAADVVIFDDELSPRHQRELEMVLGEEIKLLDRTALILDIFAQHANTRGPGPTWRGRQVDGPAGLLAALACAVLARRNWRLTGG